jgi:hypothetical protein
MDWVTSLGGGARWASGTVPAFASDLATRRREVF